MKQLISFLAIAILMVACGEKKSKYELHYTAIEKINVEASAFDAAILSNEWDANTGKGVITFDAPITTIDKKAFSDAITLQSIVIPSTVKTIKSSAFNGCSNLYSVVFPNGLLIIGPYSFCSCSRLQEVTIPDSVTTIGENAFGDCLQLQSITIGSGVTMIEDWAFSFCTKLSKIYFRGLVPPATNSYVIHRSGAYGYQIYVPNEALSAYKSAPIWKFFRSRIVGYDLPTQVAKE